ncbi:MAG: M28 family peptidase, partial [Muribaculaceae bacterium]|nr:M28 family peptidase [Muribaculaceae bacterium]
ARNIFAQYNPDAENRILLLAHWDCRPWAEQDPDPAKHKLPVDGANDGASGVGVLLEIARQLKANPPQTGIDILFVDAEDWGTDGDEESWALGTRYFVENPPVKDYFPVSAILLDMVGGKGAKFCREYFSEQAAPRVAQALWGIAASRGYGDIFLNQLGGAITDDHVQLIKHGIPAVDIIEYHPEDNVGFNPNWHTTSDNMEGIDPATLRAVGETVMEYIRSN